MRNTLSCWGWHITGRRRRRIFSIIFRQLIVTSTEPPRICTWLLYYANGLNSSLHEFEHVDNDLGKLYPAELEIKDATKSTTSASYLDLLLSNFTLPFISNEMISISTSQTFRSWVVIFHLRRPMAFSSLSLYDTHGLAPRMNVLFWGPGDIPVSYSNSDTSWNVWNRQYGRYGDLIQQYEVSL